jgi:hypothetical protein
VNNNSNLVPLTLNGDIRRGGWLLTGSVGNDTDAVTRGLNIRALGKSLATADAVYTEYFNAHALADPGFAFSRYKSDARWQAGTADNFLRGEAIQDISFTTQASPANSHEINGLQFADIINHIMQSHTNYILDLTGAAGSPDGIISNTDVDTTNSTAIELFIVRASNNLWSTLQRIGGGEEGGGEFYRIYFTRQNKLVYQPAPPFVSPQPSAKGTINKNHIRGQVRVAFPNSMPGQRVGQVQLTCVKNSTTVFTTEYPATPTDGKILKKKRGVWANSQARADVLSQRLYEWLTRSYTLTLEVDPGLILFGDDGVGLELGDRVLVTYDGPTEDSTTGHGVHLNISAQSMFVYSATVRFDDAGKMATGVLTLEHDNSS